MIAAVFYGNRRCVLAQLAGLAASVGTDVAGRPAGPYLAAAASRRPYPPRPPQELYPVFWSVYGPGTTGVNPANNSVFNRGGSVDVARFGIETNNWTRCGDLTSGWHYSFPELTDGPDGSLTAQFGGVPQASNLSAFLESLHHQVTVSIPDPQWGGLGVLDFEAWRPVWQDTSEKYRNYSAQLVRRAHPSWPPARVLAQAQTEFEAAGTAMFVAALKHASALRPNALWGFCKCEPLSLCCLLPDSVGASLKLEDNVHVAWLQMGCRA
jgi:hypothetical protein